MDESHNGVNSLEAMDTVKTSSCLDVCLPISSKRLCRAYVYLWGAAVSAAFR